MKLAEKIKYTYYVKVGKLWIKPALSRLQEYSLI